MSQNIWYQVAPETKDLNEKLSALKEIGISGLILETQDSDLEDKAKKLGLETKLLSDLKLNQEVSQAINDHIIARKLKATELASQLSNQEANNPEKLTSTLVKKDEVDGQTLFQALAMIFMLPGEPVIPAGIEEKVDSQSWRHLADLIKLRNKNLAAIENGKLNVTVTENNLVKIKRQKDNEVIAYFNTTTDALGFNSVASWIQNYLVGQLLPKGVVIKEVD